MIRIPFVLAAFAIAHLPAGAARSQVSRVSVKPVPHAGVRWAGKVGNVRAVVHGRALLLTKSGLAADAKASPNGRAVGWVEGQVIPYPDRDAPMKPGGGYPEVKTWFAKAVVVWRAGKPLRRFVPEKLFTVRWKFIRDGRAIAVASEGSHGRIFYQLYDIAAGRVTASTTSVNDKLPSWARVVEM